jgi:phytoene synthase
MSAAVQPAPPPFAPTESQLTVAYSVCRGITRKSARNFYYAFLVLPKFKRRALCTVYAFMRRCDDIADEGDAPLPERQAKLTAWLESLHRTLAGQPTDDPVLLALTDTQRRFNVPVEWLDQLAYGTAMDLEPQAGARNRDQPLTIRYRTFEDLRGYCYGVASVVGLVCIRIFGYRDPAAEPLAERCGLAFQLTNIIRDVKEDAAMGRIYLPEEDMAQFGVTADELSSIPNADRLRPLLELEASRAREYYQAADQLLPLIDEDCQPGLWALVTIYRKLLDKIAARQYDVFSRKISLTTAEKLTVLWKGFLKRLL